jgi:glutathione S-transferase
MRTLYGLSQSPWTEKARWALDHHGIAYRYHEHVPVLGEVFLRLKSKRPPGEKPSVPLLVDGADVLPSSLAIARHADGKGRGEPLFPREHEEAVLRWAEISDRIIDVGRVKVLRDLKKDRAAQREALPDFIPGALRGAFTPMATTASVFLAKKYGVARDFDREVEARLRPALEEVRRALKGDYLEGRFTFADVAIAASLRTLTPESRASIGPATRALWTNDALAAEYADLLTWRDSLYRRHRV